MNYKIVTIIGARPQFIKHFCIEQAAKNKLDLFTVHTGQHYDNNMSQIFFDQLGMSKPNYMFDHGGKGHAQQTGEMMIDIDKVIKETKADGVLVYGDTNSTVAGALVASKLNIPLFHVEAGLRSFNKSMPEEINRILTDHMSDLLFVPSTNAEINLVNEGITKGVSLVGDIMKDLVMHVQRENLLRPLDNTEEFIYVTLHRPYNVDVKDRLATILKSLNELSHKVIFPIHPRTKKKMKIFNFVENNYPNILFTEPKSYLDNLSYLKSSEVLITDSGGMQKEAYWLEKPCITVRSETEWIETQKGNANTLLFEQIEQLGQHIKLSNIQWDSQLYGDGKASIKIVKLIREYLNRN